jgi:nucleoside-diphosphate-sugar epimerase
MILVTGGTGLVGAHLLLHIIQDDSASQSKVQLPIDLYLYRKNFV